MESKIQCFHPGLEYSIKFTSEMYVTKGKIYNNYMYLLVTITILNTFRAKPLLSGLGSLYLSVQKYKMEYGTKFYSCYTLSSLHHWLQASYTNTMNYSIPIATFYWTCMSSLLEIVSAVLPADTLADAASFCLGQQEAPRLFSMDECCGKSNVLQIDHSHNPPHCIERPWS